MSLAVPATQTLFSSCDLCLLTIFLTTLFPLRLSTNTGIRAVDLGMPQLSMHSIREMMGCEDLTHAGNLFEAYFRDFRAIETSLRVDTL